MFSTRDARLVSLSGEIVARLKGGAAAVGGIRVASVGLTFLFFLVLARSMTAAEFGIFSTAYSLATIISYFANVGQHVAVLRFYPTVDEKCGPSVAQQVITRGLVLVSAGGLISGLGVAVFFATQVSGRVAGWTGVFLLAGALAEYSCSAMRARGRLVWALLPRDILWRCAVILVVLVISRPLSADLALALVALSLIAAFSPQLCVLVRNSWLSRGAHLSGPDANGMKRATLGLWASTSVTPFVEHMATIVVAIALGPVAAGAFFAADRLAKLLSIGLVASEQIASPDIARKFHGGRISEVRKLVRIVSMSVLLFAVVGGLMFSLAGKYALTIFDPSYGSAYSALLILVLGQILSAASGPSAMFLNMAGGERYLLLIRSVWGVAALVLIYFGAAQYGLTGAAVANSLVLVGWTMSAAAVCSRRFGVVTGLVGLLAARRRGALG